MDGKEAHPSRSDVQAGETNTGSGQQEADTSANGLSQGNPRPDVARRFLDLQREFLNKQREQAPEIIVANKARVQQWLQQRNANMHQLPSQSITKSAAVQPQGLKNQASGDLDAEEAAAEQDACVPTEPREVKLALKRTVGVRMAKEQLNLKVPANLIPLFKPAPFYWTWAYLKRNELACDHGKRMFYTDDTGETVPASEDEEGDDDDDLPWETKDGSPVDFALKQVVDELGRSDEVIKAIAIHLRVKPESVIKRLGQLNLPQLHDEERAHQDASEVLEAYTSAFCRRCRIYSCRLHGGGHVRPHRRPSPPPVRNFGSNCGPKCWKLAPLSVRQVLLQAHEELDEAAQREDEQAQAELLSRAQSAGTANAAAEALVSTAIAAAAAAAQAAPPPAGDGPAAAAAAAADSAAGLDASGSGASSGSSRAAKRPSVADGDTVAERPAAKQLVTSRDSDSAGSAEAGPSGGLPAASPAAAAAPAAQDSMKPLVAAFAAAAAAAASGNGAASTSGSGGGGAAPSMKRWEESLLKRAYKMYGPNCCAIARLLGSKDCAGIAVQLATMLSADAEQLQADRKAGRKTKNPKKNKIFQGSTKRSSSVVMKRYLHQENEAWSEYVPCTCGDVCASDCPCLKSKNFCEKYCACSKRCANKFKGCKCTSQCKMRSCPCLAAGRECDPDLCKNCTATCDGHAPPGTECHNMRMRLRQHLRVFMGKSTIAGWGAFLEQECKKEEFIGEYTGDLITQEEADRRGRIYDKINNSYLFNLNEQWVLDARHRGNKLRFANHSSEPNCKARIVMVDGDHRVAIYANKNIDPGEELFYDYRYDRDMAPDWAQKDGKA